MGTSPVMGDEEEFIAGGPCRRMAEQLLTLLLVMARDKIQDKI